MGNGRSSRLKILLSRVPNDPLFLLRLLYLLSLTFLFSMYSTEAANRLTKRSIEPLPGAMFTFQLIKTVSDEKELGYDGDHSACFR
jgi:hypothetical protein